VVKISKEIEQNPLANLMMGMGSQSKKIEKAAKATGGMFKSLMSAVPGVGPVMRLLGSLSSILDVMKPFEVIIKIISALLSVMSAEIIKPLFMALRPVMDVLMSLTPIFKMLGKIIGVVLQIGLIPLTVIFKLLDKLLTPLLPLLDPFLKALDKISPMIDVITDILVNVLFVAIKWVFDKIGIIIVAIKPVIDFIVISIKTVFDWIVSVVKGFLNAIILIINSIRWALNLIPGVDIPYLSYLQHGGIITSPTLAMMGEKESEAVIPLSKLDEFIKPSGGIDPELIYELQENRKTNLLILLYIKEGY